ncbi:MAG: hypothetical protein WD181_02100 [Solirubrobacterales bacterium]
MPLLLTFVLLCAYLAASPGADAAPVKRIVLGQSTERLQPNCGTDFSRDCVVEGRVTGYQVFRKGSARKRGFVVPWSGRVVSWSISLSRPTRRVIRSNGIDQPAQFPFFNDLFGPPASARVAVLRELQPGKPGPAKFKMVRQSPVEILNPYFGRTVHFALEKPMNVVKNQVVALTIPTWAPAVWKPRSCSFNPISGVQDPEACAAAEKEYTWRGSRAAGKCKLGILENGQPNEALEKTSPQQRVDSDRAYGCYYGSNVLLYTATIIGKN